MLDDDPAKSVFVLQSEFSTPTAKITFCRVTCMHCIDYAVTC